MSELPNCPKCDSSFTYQDWDNYICPECAFEWRLDGGDAVGHVVRDSNGNVLNSGDTVSVTKDLKIKGSSAMLKVGTKVKNIRVLDAHHMVDGHDIDCKTVGFAAIKLKGSVVKKV